MNRQSTRVVYELAVKADVFKLTIGLSKLVIKTMHNVFGANFCTCIVASDLYHGHSEISTVLFIACDLSRQHRNIIQSATSINNDLCESTDKWNRIHCITMT